VVEDKMTAQRSITVTGVSPGGSYDRARGGKIQIRLVIPSKTYSLDTRDGGTVTTDEMVAEFEIDLEELPLVNVAGYKIEEEQYAPDRMSYPYGKDQDDGGDNKYGTTFG